MTAEQLRAACRLSAGTIASATGLRVDQVQAVELEPDARQRIEAALRPERNLEMKYVNPYHQEMSPE